MAPSKSSSLPPVEDWTTPLAWGGSPLRPLGTGRLEFPPPAAYVRAALVYTLEREIGPGMTSQTEQGAWGLLRLEKGKGMEVHTPGLDGQCWSWKILGKGRGARWTLHAGAAYPAEEANHEGLVTAHGIQSVVVQSVVPAEGSGQFVSFRIWADGRMEDFSKLSAEDGV